MNGSPLLLAQGFPGFDGFLGTRAAIMTDVVFVAMFAVVPIMAWSIWLVRGRGLDGDAKLLLHKRVQLALGVILLIAVIAFEVDLRLLTSWKDRAAPSRHFIPGAWCVVWYCLSIHLVFAVPTLLMWVYVIAMGLRKFEQSPRPNEYSATHRVTGRLAAIGMSMTALTGWIFYYLAFVA